MYGRDNCKMVKLRHKCFLSLLKKMFWKVTLAVVNMPLCIRLFNHEKKPSRKYVCLKYLIFIFIVTKWTAITVHDSRNDNTVRRIVTYR